ncbi:hypothetical protein NM688_g8483 [Phlebia brevispora]|uniref:Uncharacterized protein n=1 Tax=Phlebia brevispora TaxID=194682 RepID=A0ACC1RU35_9APHY|nr:hypothetical protein NM688_g8483 [Phlebia brevispora]
MSHTRNHSKASISRPTSIDMNPNENAFAQPPRPAPVPTDSKHSSKGSFSEHQRGTSGATRERRSSTATRPSVDLGRSSVDTKMKFPQSEQRGSIDAPRPSFSSERTSISSQSSQTPSFMSRNPNGKPGATEKGSKRNMFDPSLPRPDVGEGETLDKGVAERLSLGEFAPDARPPSLVKRVRKFSGRVANHLMPKFNHNPQQPGADPSAKPRIFGVPLRRTISEQVGGAKRIWGQIPVKWEFGDKWIEDRPPLKKPSQFSRKPGKGSQADRRAQAQEALKSRIRTPHMPDERPPVEASRSPCLTRHVDRGQPSQASPAARQRQTGGRGSGDGQAAVLEEHNVPGSCARDGPAGTWALQDEI